MLKKVIEKVVLKLEARAIAQNNILYVTDRDNPNEVYLKRYPIFNNSAFGLYIHRFMKSDQDDPHDHPFDFISYVVKGQYYEKRYQHDYVPLFGIHQQEEGSALRREGTFAVRFATQAHSVKLEKEFDKKEDYKDAVLTVILRGPRYRQWGFWKGKTPNNDVSDSFVSWVHYSDYRPDGGYKTPETLKVVK